MRLPFHTVRFFFFKNRHLEVFFGKDVLKRLVNTFSTNFPFVCPLKTLGKLWFSDVFSGYKMEHQSKVGYVHRKIILYYKIVFMKNFAKFTGKCLQWRPEVYSEPRRTSKMEFFEKIVNYFQPLIIFAKSSILDIRLGSEYAS